MNKLVTMHNMVNFMELALLEAELAAKRGEVPVGAIIVNGQNNEVIARSGNQVEELMDPTAHAEIISIRNACRALSSQRLVNCDLYVTLEPCPMCAQAISFSRIRRLYFGAYDLKGGGVDNGANIFHANSCHHKPEVYGGIKEKQSALMLKNFFIPKRS